MIVPLVAVETGRNFKYLTLRSLNFCIYVHLPCYNLNPLPCLHYFVFLLTVLPKAFQGIFPWSWTQVYIYSCKVYLTWGCFTLVTSVNREMYQFCLIYVYSAGYSGQEYFSVMSCGRDKIRESVFHSLLCVLLLLPWEIFLHSPIHWYYSYMTGVPTLFWNRIEFESKIVCIIQL